MRLFTWLAALAAAAAPIDAAPVADVAKRGVPTHYIVLFQNAADTPEAVYDDVLQHLKDLGAQVNYEYRSIVKGFSVSLDSSLVDKLTAFNNPEYPFIVEADKDVHAQ